MDKSNAGIDPLTVIPYWPDKRQAIDDLDSLNINKKAAKPIAWQDHNVFINVYKTWLKTNQRELAIIHREEMLITEKTTRPEAPVEWGWGWSASWLWASMIASDNAQGQAPNLGTI
jgi:hypothetical protein